MMEKETELILKLSSEVVDTDLDEQSKNDLMFTFSLMQEHSIDLDEFVANLHASIDAAKASAPEVIPTMLLVAADVARQYA